MSAGEKNKTADNQQEEKGWISNDYKKRGKVEGKKRKNSFLLPHTKEMP